MSIYDNVKEYYGKILENTSSLKTSACTSSSNLMTQLLIF